MGDLPARRRFNDRSNRYGARLRVQPWHSRRLKTNAWFTKLMQQGYRINVYQPDYIDYCAHPAVKKCLIYRSNGLSALLPLELALWAKAKLVLRNFAAGALTTRWAWRGLDRLADAFPGNPYLSPATRQLDQPVPGPLTSRTPLRLAAADLARHRGGVAYFIHLLLPHNSYVFNAARKLLQDTSDWLNFKPYGWGNRPGERRVRYAR